VVFEDGPVRDVFVFIRITTLTQLTLHAQVLVLTSAGQTEKTASAIATALIQSADADLNRNVDMSEFVAYIVRKFEAGDKEAETSLAQLEAVVLGERYIVARAVNVFRMLDLDGDGSLTPSELMALLEASGESESFAWAKTIAFLGIADKDSNMVRIL
jgi:hypothetical protein